MKETIAIISSVHYWDDTRILFKEAFSLNKHFPVEIHALSNFKYRKYDKIEIFGLKLFKTRFLRPINWIALWKRTLRKNIKVVIFHDPELIPLGLFLKIFTSKIVAYDIREDYGKTILEKKWITFGFIRKIISFFFIKFERFLTGFFDINIIVLDKWKNKYKNYIIAKNYPILNEQKNLPIGKRKNYIVYIGTLNEKRGIIQMLSAFDKISKINKNIELILIGEWTDQKTEKEAKIIINNNKKIKLKGYLNLAEAYEIIKKARGGLCIYTMEQYAENIPVKIYEYMMFGTPVIYSNFDSWVNIIGKEGWGLPADPHDITDITQAILKIFDDKKFKKLNAACMKYNFKYSWENEAVNLIKKIDELINT